MTETITTDARYGFDDTQVGDVVRITRGELAAEGKVTRAGHGSTVTVNSIGGPIDVERRDTITLLRRPDPVADLVAVWTAKHPHDEVARMMTDNARGHVRHHWPLLADALDKLAQARP